MKIDKLITGILLFCLALVNTSCYDLDVFPPEEIGPNAFWKSKEDLDMGVSGTYSKLYQGYFGMNRYWLEGLTDNGYCQHISQGDFSRMQSGILEPTTGGPVSDIYAGCYVTIAACNGFLKNFYRVKDNLGLTVLEQAKYEAEIRFLRALSYFDLVQYYGDVPLYKEAIESVEASKVKQSPASEVYAFIYEDLDFAIEGLPETAYSTGHPVKGTAKGLKARVALSRNDWTLVKKETEDIIESKLFSLAESSSSVFIKNDGQKNNPEILFSVNYLNPDTRHNAEMEFYSWAALSPTNDLLKSYDIDTDNRVKEWYGKSEPGKNTWINPFGEDATTEEVTRTGWILIKHLDKYNKKTYNLSPYDFRTDNNIILLRYADIYLMYIEAMVEIEGGNTSDANAVKYMNEIRTRAGLSANVTSISRDQLRLERRKELAFEGLRYFDLIRWRIAVDVMNNLTTPGGKCSFEEKFYTWPFPQREIDINPQLDQKPLW